MKLHTSFMREIERIRVYLATHRRVRTAILTSGGAVLFALILAAGVISGIRAAAPPFPEGADLFALNRPPAYTFLDANGEHVGYRGAVAGERLTLADMPPYLPAAFLAVEDRRFYRHSGVDWRGVTRAVIADLRAGKFVQGGSTITQQLAKILFLNPERTLGRKLQEMGAAWELERRLPKERILQLYLNRIYLGSGAYGVDGAAQLYFGKSASEVTLAEAAMLAALTRAPSTFSPRRDLPAAQARAALVLDAMVETGAIGEGEANAARSYPAKIVARAEANSRAYFFDAALAEVKRRLHEKGDLVIVTSMNAKMQEQARAALAGVMGKQGKETNAHQAALVAMTPDGRVRALVGGTDYAESPFNRATDAHRQPGSAFKPFVYLAALERGMSPYTIRYDDPVEIDGYAPENYDSTDWGRVTLSQALSRSINRVAVELGQEIGPAKVVEAAKRLGIVSKLAPHASLPLGTSEVTPLELTGAYAAFASGGIKALPSLIEEVRTVDGNLVYKRTDQQGGRVIGEREVEAMNAMLYEVVQSGTGRGAQVSGHEIAGKTGTSAAFRDAWFVGYSPSLVTGVWVGNDDSKPMKKVTGGALPARIFKNFMQNALKDVTPVPLARDFPEPETGWSMVWHEDVNDLPRDERAVSFREPESGRYTRDLEREMADRERITQEREREAADRARYAREQERYARDLERYENNRRRYDDNSDVRPARPTARRYREGDWDRERDAVWERYVRNERERRRYQGDNPETDSGEPEEDFQYDDEGPALPPYAVQRRDGYWVPVPDDYDR